MKKKFSDLLINYLSKKGLNQFFAISGGASLHLIHSIAENKKTSFLCPQHEQTAAMAADGYFRVSGKLACAIATSGPGATNLVTGISSAYYDSIPMLIITGQVASFRSKRDTGVRQMGFQETEIVNICSTITKYAKQIKNPQNILLEINKALDISLSGRPGPVLIDIPDDIQRMMIEEKEIRKPTKKIKKQQKKSDEKLSNYARITFNNLNNHSRPVLALGWGIHLSNSRELILPLIEKLNIPVVVTWAIRDLLPENTKNLMGGFGTHGNRAANFTIQNSDLVIAIGTRLDSKATGSPASTFARKAKILMVDIDECETSKFKILDKIIHHKFNCDANNFINILLKNHNKFDPTYEDWLIQTKKWKKTFPIHPKKYLVNKQAKTNPYYFVKQLSSICRAGQTFFSDTGCGLAWMMQAFEFKKNQRFIHAFNNTPMGYGLSASIGASAFKKNKIILISGDGSILMSLQELATIERHKIPLKVILFNNHGHGMVRQTQDMWLDNNYYATSIKGGLPDPNFISIFEAFNFKTFRIDKNFQIPQVLKDFYAYPGPTFLNVEINFGERVIPQVKYGRPNEDAEPLLDRKIFESNMIIPSLDVSKNDID
jgi:acetolactate synthase I/II/III large subunit